MVGNIQVDELQPNIEDELQPNIVGNIEDKLQQNIEDKHQQNIKINSNTVGNTADEICELEHSQGIAIS